MDSLPKDPPDSNNNSAPLTGNPPPFGSDFNPHTNPIDPNNPYQTQPQPNSVPPPPQIPPTKIPNPLNVPSYPNFPNNNPDSSKHTTYSEVAQHKTRDAHGRFIAQHQTPLIYSEHETNPNPQGPPNPSASPNPTSFLPPIIEVNKNTEPSDKKDPPLFGFFLTNPVTYLKLFLRRLLKRQAVTLRIPVLVILIVIVGAGSYSAGLKTGIDYTLGKLFPNFSPIL